MTETIEEIEYCPKCGGVTKLVRKGAEGCFSRALNLKWCSCVGELID